MNYYQDENESVKNLLSLSFQYTFVFLYINPLNLMNKFAFSIESTPKQRVDKRDTFLRGKTGKGIILSFVRVPSYW